MSKKGHVSERREKKMFFSIQKIAHIMCLHPSFSREILENLTTARVKPTYFIGITCAIYKGNVYKNRGGLLKKGRVRARCIGKYRAFKSIATCTRARLNRDFIKKLLHIVACIIIRCDV